MIIFLLKHDEIEQDLLKKDQIVLTLTMELNNATAKFENMKNKLESQINGVEADIKHLIESSEKADNQINMESVPYEELIKNFNNTVQNYEETKRYVISK